MKDYLEGKHKVILHHKHHLKMVSSKLVGGGGGLNEGSQLHTFE